MFIYCLLLLSYEMKVLQQSSVESVVYIWVTHLQLLVSFLYSQAAFDSMCLSQVVKQVYCFHIYLEQLSCIFCKVMCFVGGCLNSYLCHYYIITRSRDRALVVRYAWAYLIVACTRKRKHVALLEQWCDDIFFADIYITEYIYISLQSAPFVRYCLSQDENCHNLYCTLSATSGKVRPSSLMPVPDCSWETPLWWTWNSFSWQGVLNKLLKKKIKTNSLVS